MPLAHKHLLITGTFRSGTSLLNTCLNAHPHVFIGWQPYWLFLKECWFKFVNNELNHPIATDYPMGLYKFQTQHDRKKFTHLFENVSFSKDELAPLIVKIKQYLEQDSEQFNSRMKNVNLAYYLHDITPGPVGEIMEQLLQLIPHAAAASKKNTKENDLSTTGIKEVFCEEFIDPFLHYWGDKAVAFHIIRDPRAIVASRNYGKYMEATGSKYPLFFIIQAWKRSVANYLLNRTKKNYLLIKYEELTTQPNTVLASACELLGEQFDTDMVTFEKFHDSTGKRWTGNSSFGETKKISTASINKWQKVLPKEQIEIIEYYCNEEMHKLGYTPTHSSFNKEYIRRYQEDTSLINSWLHPYCPPPDKF